MQRLSRVATLTARSTLLSLTGSDDESLKADEGIVSELVDCFIFNSSCSLFVSVLPSEKAKRLVREKRLTFSYQVGVHGLENSYRYLASLVLARLIGDVVDSIARANCTGETLTWTDDGCVKSYVGTTEALPISVKYSDENGAPLADEDSADKLGAPVWTESIWGVGGIRGRVFLEPSMMREVMIIVSGILVALAFAVLMYFIDLRSDILFNAVTPKLPAVKEPALTQHESTGVNSDATGTTLTGMTSTQGF